MLTGSPGATSQRRGRGRPKGAKNRRSLDLAKWIEATMGGQTPGQQVAALAMVSPGDLKRAKADALELGIPHEGLAVLQIAMVVKAERLAKALDITRAEAWAALHKVLFELMPYVHQRQPQAEAAKVKDQLPIAFLIPDGGVIADLPALEDVDSEALDFLGEVDPPAR